MNFEQLLKQVADCGDVLTKLEDALKAAGKLPQDVYIVGVTSTRGFPNIHYVKESDVKTRSLSLADLGLSESRRTKSESYFDIPLEIAYHKEGDFVISKGDARLNRFEIYSPDKDAQGHAVKLSDPAARMPAEGETCTGLYGPASWCYKGTDGEWHSGKNYWVSFTWYLEGGKPYIESCKITKAANNWSDDYTDEPYTFPEGAQACVDMIEDVMQQGLEYRYERDAQSHSHPSIVSGGFSGMERPRSADRGI